MKHRLHALTAALDAAFPEVGQPLRVNLTGCFHACAQPQVADIGLTGGRARVGEETVPVYTVMVGGHLGKDAAFAAPLEGRVADANLEALLKAFVQQYAMVSEFSTKVLNAVSRRFIGSAKLSVTGLSVPIFSTSLIAPKPEYRDNAFFSLSVACLFGAWIFTAVSMASTFATSDVNLL